MKHQDTAARLKEALNDKNMKPQELANLTGINKASISQYVNGTYKPSNLSAGKIGKVLGVSPLWLMGLSDNKIDIEELQNQLIKTRMEYINTPETESDKLNQLEIKIDKLEKQIKNAVNLEEKPLKITVVESDIGFMPKHSKPLTIQEVRERISQIGSADAGTGKSSFLEETIKASKALELYEKYEKADPKIKAAVEALLKDGQ